MGKKQTIAEKCALFVELLENTEMVCDGGRSGRSWQYQSC